MVSVSSTQVFSKSVVFRRGLSMHKEQTCIFSLDDACFRFKASKPNGEKRNVNFPWDSTVYILLFSAHAELCCLRKWLPPLNVFDGHPWRKDTQLMPSYKQRFYFGFHPAGVWGGMFCTPQINLSTDALGVQVRLKLEAYGEILSTGVTGKLYWC